MEDKFKSLIDKRNIELWDRLNNKFKIEIINNGFYKLDYNSDERSAIIHVDDRNDINLFTHELLHLELRYFNLDTEKYFNFSKYNNYEIQTAYNLINNIEHILFYDEFIDLGFDSKMFVEGISNKKQLTEQLNNYDLLKTNQDLCRPNLYFASLYFTLKAEEYYGNKRFEYLDKLRKLNKTYCTKCEKTYSYFIELDLENNPQYEFIKAMDNIFN